MTPDEEFLALLPSLPEAHKDVYRVMAEASGVSVVQLVGRQMALQVAPMISNGWQRSYNSYMESKKVVKPVEPTILRIGDDGRKYDQHDKRLCDMSECLKPHVAKGMCQSHRDEAIRLYVPILPIVVNPEGLRFDAAGIQICKTSDHRAVTKGLCAKCYITEYNRKQKGE